VGVDVIGWFPRSSEVMRAAELWSGCVAGALEKAEYEALLRSVGFEEVSVEVTHTYQARLASSGPASRSSRRYWWERDDGSRS
jgi:hypothetical protein